ncbi:MAG: hypothetical protein U5K28_11930 [Halobacteriales archaeon]|nr:hypothetical protein [Halobacteriales archaeon]
MSDVDVAVDADGAVNWTEETVTTADDGTATFTANSTEIGEYNVNFTDDQGNQVETTATFRPEEGDSQLYGEVSTNETEGISDATVWVAYQGENQTLGYAQENQEYLVSQTTDEGEYSIEGIVTDGDTDTVNVYVLASGYNADNETDSECRCLACTQDETQGSDQVPRRITTSS